MSFLPEDDQDFLDDNGLKYELLTEKLPDGTERNGVLFPGFTFIGNLRTMKDGGLVQCAVCDLLIIIPKGYSTTKLDSFYTLQWLKRPDGADPVNANVVTLLFEKNWQFWSRHLDDKDWHPGKDDLRGFLAYIRNEFRIA